MEEIKYPLHVISRIRMATDGAGVTTLVTSVGCPLKCRYCLNPKTWQGNVQYKLVTVDELYDELKIDNLYFLATGGGVMFGGGEPLLQADFLKLFFEKYQSTGWKFNLETSLSVPWNQIEKIADYIDWFFIDSKDMDAKRYHAYTDGDISLFIENLQRLLARVGEEKITVRVPYIKGYNTREQVQENCDALRKLGVKYLDVFDYRITKDEQNATS